MNAERYQRIKDLFLAARDKTARERASLLDRVGREDASLRAEVDSLLAEDDRSAAVFGAGGLRKDDPASVLGDGSRSSVSAPGVPENIGSYKILDVIGEGGMGIVYRAEQEKPRRAVALKVIKSGIAGIASPARLERFEQEAEVLGRLHHPGIAQIYEAGAADTGHGPQPFFAMELIEGQPLTEYAESRELGARERLELVVKLCDAVDHAHEKGVIHRDLKPGNILVDEYGQPKVLDFGVARTVDADVRNTLLRTVTGELIGTIPYMSPEQVAANPEEIDALSDVYAVGVICYELLCGRFPYPIEGKPLPEVIRVICERNPTPLGSVDKALRGDIETIVAQALEKDKTGRYRSAAAFAAEIRQYLEDELTRARVAEAGKSATSGAPLNNLPFARNPFFTGREEVLTALHETLSQSRKAALAQIQAISGLGGIGKTQTAVEYAYRYFPEYEAVLWARAESRDELLSSFVEIAGRLGLSATDEKDTGLAVSAVKRWLEASSGWLLIFDNADKPEMIEEFLPSSPAGHILLTSRAQVFRALGISKPIEMEQMTREEALEFLFRSTGADESDDGEKKAAVEIAAEVGFLPLALEQAAHFIAENQARFEDYLTAYRRHRLSLLGEAKPKDYHHSLTTTWDMSFVAVEKVSQAAADLLRLSAFLSPDAVPVELIAKGASECGPALAAALADAEENLLLVNKTLEPLTRYSLIRIEPGSQSYTVHRLVQEVAKGKMDGDARRLWAERAVRTLNRVFPGVRPCPEQFDQWFFCGRLLPHAQSAIELVKGFQFEFEEALQLVDKIGFYSLNSGQFTEAERLFRYSLQIREETLGPEHQRYRQVLCSDFFQAASFSSFF